MDKFQKIILQRTFCCRFSYLWIGALLPLPQNHGYVVVVHRFQVLTRSCLWTLLDRVSDGQIYCKIVKKSGGLRPPNPPPGLRPWTPLGAAPPDPRGAPSAALRATSLALYQTEPARFARSLPPPCSNIVTEALFFII